MVRMQIPPVFTWDQCYMAICILECRDGWWRATRVANQVRIVHAGQSCWVNHDPQHSFARIPRQEFNPQLSLASRSFRAAQDRARIREFLIRTESPPGSFAISPNRYHLPWKRDDPLFRPTLSINPLAARDQPVRTVQLSKGSSPSLAQR